MPKSMATAGVDMELTGDARFLESQIKGGAALGAQAIVVGVHQETWAAFPW